MNWICHSIACVYFYPNTVNFAKHVSLSKQNNRLSPQKIERTKHINKDLEKARWPKTPQYKKPTMRILHLLTEHITCVKESPKNTTNHHPQIMFPQTNLSTRYSHNGCHGESEDLFGTQAPALLRKYKRGHIKKIDITLQMSCPEKRERGGEGNGESCSKILFISFLLDVLGRS